MIYHFTDTAHPPWILSAGELRPGANTVGGYPEPEFIWATTDDRGSRTATGGSRGFREGLTRPVRFTLHAEDFVPWAEIRSRYPTWTPDQIARLEDSARRKGDHPARWWCRVQPFRLTRSTIIETRSYLVRA